MWPGKLIKECTLGGFKSQGSGDDTDGGYMDRVVEQNSLPVDQKVTPKFHQTLVNLSGNESYLKGEFEVKESLRLKTM